MIVWGLVPTSFAVTVAEQAAVLAAPGDNVHVAPGLLKVSPFTPVSEEAKFTVPVGFVLAAEPVSVIVAVNITESPTFNVEVSGLTAVLVGLVTATVG